MKKLICGLLLSLTLPFSTMAEPNPTAVEVAKHSASNISIIKHMMLIDNKKCSETFTNNGKVLYDHGCDTTVLAVLEDGSGIVQFYNKNKAPYSIKVIPLNSGNSIKMKVPEMLVGENNFEVDGECIGNPDLGSFDCTMVKKDDNNTTVAHFNAEGGNKYLIK